MVELGNRAERRSDALSKARIVGAAVEVLDEGGAEALTFRTLASRLRTGAGAIYHHVANKHDLLSAAVDDVMTSTLDLTASDDPQRDIRAVMLGAFDVMSAHPWVGTQLATAPWQPAVLRLFERVSSAVDALAVPDDAQFDAASVLVHHVLGVASQHDAVSRLQDAEMDRQAFLGTAVADLVQSGSPAGHPFVTRLSEQLARHDDREQFRAGVDIILAGINTL